MGRWNRVTVFSWRGMVWQLGAGELRQATTVKPGNTSTAQLAVGLALLIIGAVFLRGAGWLHRRRAVGAPPARASQITVPMAATFLAAGTAVAAAASTDTLWLVLLVTAAGWTASALLLRRPARGRRPDALRAPPRTAGQCRSDRPNPAASGIRSPSGGGAASASLTGRA